MLTYSIYITIAYPETLCQIWQINYACSRKKLQCVSEKSTFIAEHSQKMKKKIIIVSDGKKIPLDWLYPRQWQNFRGCQKQNRYDAGNLT